MLFATLLELMTQTGTDVETQLITKLLPTAAEVVGIITVVWLFLRRQRQSDGVLMSVSRSQSALAESVRELSGKIKLIHNVTVEGD